MKTNAQLQKDVYEELKWDPRIHEGDIGVSVDNGVVSLSGSIPNYPEKWAAEEACERVAGVMAVLNKIDVKLPSIWRKDDNKIAEVAVQTLANDVWVPKDAIKILVGDGWITLKGTVEWEYQKNHAERALRNISGVRGIVNEITVKSKVKVADVKEKIEEAILRSAKADSDKISVSVTDGEVKLKGKVHSNFERREAEWAAWGTPGVHRVRNEVTIQY